MQPDPHFRQHHDVEPPRVDARAFRQAWRIRSRLDALLLADDITPREHRAAVDYRNLWILALGSSLKSSALTTEGGKTPRGDYPTVQRLDALAALRMTRKHLGTFACALLDACLIDDLSWNNLGRNLNVDHKTAKSWTIAAIKMLTTVP